MSRHTLLVASASVLWTACAPSPAPAPVVAPRAVATQSQSLVASAAGVYTVRFEQEAEQAATSQLALVQGEHQLSVTEGDGELRIQLSNGSLQLSGLADELDDRRWIAGLAGADPQTAAPVVMQITAVHDRGQLTGSVMIDVDSKSYTASFVGVRATPSRTAATTPAASPNARESTSTFMPGAPQAPAAPANEADASTSHYHLPDGVH